MPLEWNIHYAGWMIDDGLPGRRVGESFVWEVEFRPCDKLTKVTDRIKSAISLPDYNYRVVAELFHLSEKGCLLDFGLKVFGATSTLPAQCEKGDYLAGDINLGLVHGRAYPPEVTHEALSRHWHVNSILADVTPYILHHDKPQYFCRDESRTLYERAEFTTRYEVKDYVLQCIEDV